MPAKRINQIITELPFEKKLLGAGSLFMAISVFLPWYQDIDSFKTGDMYLGVSGPLYLAGFTILAFAVTNIIFIILDGLGQKIPYVTIKPSMFYMISGLSSFYLLMMVNSVYFHQKFGINITVKESQFGMFFAFIAASLMTIGAYLTSRERGAILKEFQEKAQEQVIKLPQQEPRRPKENLRPVQPARPVEKPAQTQLSESPSIEKSTVSSEKTYQPYRMDL